MAATVAAFPWNRFFGRGPCLTDHFEQIKEGFDPEWIFTLAFPAVLGCKAALAEPHLSLLPHATYETQLKK